MPWLHQAAAVGAHWSAFHVLLRHLHAQAHLLHHRGYQALLVPAARRLLPSARLLPAVQLLPATQLRLPHGRHEQHGVLRHKGERRRHGVLHCQGGGGGEGVGCLLGLHRGGRPGWWGGLLNVREAGLLHVAVLPAPVAEELVLDAAVAARVALLGAPGVGLGGGCGGG